MSATIEITLPPASLALLARIADRPGVMKAIAVEMDQQNHETIGHIQKVRMRGNNGKPFPPSDHKLGIRSHLAETSLNQTPAVVNGNAVQSSIGSDVGYLKVHEFGGTFTVTKKPGVVRLRTDAGGNLLRQGKNGKLAIFAKTTHKRAKEVSHAGSTYTVTVPERAPIRYGIMDRADAYGAAIGQAIIAFWEGGGR